MDFTRRYFKVVFSILIPLAGIDLSKSLWGWPHISDRILLFIPGVAFYSITFGGVLLMFRGD
jgi:uncharacterized membrane protein YqaE (UPF0057 family)